MITISSLTATIVIPIILTIVAAGLGGLFLTAVIIRIRHPETQESARAQQFDRQYWLKQIRQWRIALDSSTIDEELREVRQSWNMIQLFPAPIILPVLVCISMIMSVWQVPLLWFFPAMSTLFACVLLVRSWTYSRGFARLRKQAENGIFYGDLRRRTLSDYRWLPFRILIICSILFALITTIVSYKYLSGTLILHIPGNAPIEVAHSGWILIGANGAMLLICAVAEIFSQRFATYSRLLITSHPSSAKQFDDLFRAKVLGELQGDEFTAIAYLYIVQFSLLSFAVFSNIPAYLHAIFFTGLGVAFLIYIIGMLSYGFNGRIGGSVSGWRWQQEAR